jgi:hypothetical protein
MRSKSWADTEANPLTLLAGYKRNPDAFARPGPPPQPPLPLKFTCKACGREVAPNASRCGWCGEQMWGVDH